MTTPRTTYLTHSYHLYSIMYEVSWPLSAGNWYDNHAWARNDVNASSRWILNNTVTIYCFSNAIFGSSAYSKGPLLLFLCSFLIWWYPLYAYRVSIDVQVNVAMIRLAGFTSARRWRPGVFFFNSLAAWFQVIPATWNLTRGCHYTYLAWNVFMWMCWLATKHADPGYLPIDSGSYIQTIRQVDRYAWLFE